MRIFGGKDRIVELTPVIGDNRRILSFRAERWTKRDPFGFRIDRFGKGRWTVPHNGDTTIRVDDFQVRVEVDLGDKLAEKRRMVYRRSFPRNSRGVSY